MVNYFNVNFIINIIIINKNYIIAVLYGNSNVLIIIIIIINNNNIVLFYCIGMYGQLGHGNTEKQSLPKMVAALSDSTVYLLACGNFHTVSMGEL